MMQMSDTGTMLETDMAHHSGNEEHDPGHGHVAVDETLGPPDLMAWAYALAGGAVGVIVALALYAASAA